MLVSVVALVALAVRTGIDQPTRVIGGTLMFAVIYLAIGALVGIAVSNPVNGAVVILFIWIIDVFFGPARIGRLWRLGRRPGKPRNHVDEPNDHLCGRRGAATKRM